MSRSLIFSLLLVALAPITTFAAPKSELWSYWQQSKESSRATISHQKWKSILTKYLSVNSVDGVNRFDYAAVSDSDKLLLESYLSDLQNIDPRNHNRSEQFAYWINFRTACTSHVNNFFVCFACLINPAFNYLQTL